MFEKISMLETIRKDGIKKNLEIKEIESNMLAYINSLDIDKDEVEYEILHTLILKRTNFILNYGSSRISDSIYYFALFDLLRIPHFKKYSVNMFATFSADLTRRKEENLTFDEMKKLLYKDINRHCLYCDVSPSFFELMKKLLNVLNQENLYDDSIAYKFGLFEVLNEIESLKDKEFYSYEELQKQKCDVPFYKMVYKNADERDKVIYYIKNNPKALEFIKIASELNIADDTWDNLLHQIKQNDDEKPKVRTKSK